MVVVVVVFEVVGGVVVVPCNCPCVRRLRCHPGMEGKWGKNMRCLVIFCVIFVENMLR